MIQQKRAFMIEPESVRRMFRAKPSMNSIVVQLLVDLSALECVNPGYRSQTEEKNFAVPTESLNQKRTFWQRSIMSGVTNDNYVES
jgi:hypothetical protein